MKKDVKWFGRFKNNYLLCIQISRDGLSTEPTELFFGHGGKMIWIMKIIKIMKNYIFKYGKWCLFYYSEEICKVFSKVSQCVLKVY